MLVGHYDVEFAPEGLLELRGRDRPLATPRGSKSPGAVREERLDLAVASDALDEPSPAGHDGVEGVELVLRTYGLGQSGRKVPSGLAVATVAAKPGEAGAPGSGAERAALLAAWADGKVIPTFAGVSLGEVRASTERFVE